MGTSASAEAFVGIDVACAKGKRLPICVVVRDERSVAPLPLRDCHDLRPPPRGGGNVSALDERWRAQFAEDTHDYLRNVERRFGVTIRRIAIDAPSHPKQDGADRRLAECALDARGISCIATPSAEEFVKIDRRARDHLAAGGAPSRLPHANQLWMLVGFSLFRRLQQSWQCIEVFPHATAVVLKAAGCPKSNPVGCAERLKAASLHAGWPMPAEVVALRVIGYGAAHDKLEAYLSAWIANLEEREREALGGQPNDTIWLPALHRHADSDV